MVDVPKTLFVISRFGAVPLTLTPVPSGTFAPSLLVTRPSMAPPPLVSRISALPNGTHVAPLPVEHCAAPTGGTNAVAPAMSTGVAAALSNAVVAAPLLKYQTILPVALARTIHSPSRSPAKRNDPGA